MSDKIAEIRARHQRIETTDDDALLVNLEFSWANADRGWLLAEVERLTRQRDEARAEVENLYDQVHRWVDDRAKAQARADRLREQNYELQRERDEARAEVERLRKEMLEVAEELENEEPRSHKNIAFGIRNVLEAKP